MNRKPRTTYLSTNLAGTGYRQDLLKIKNHRKNEKHFRGIPNLELNAPRQFNLFVGKTNCGKTSLLESIFLLCGPTNVMIPLNINSFRGIRSVRDYPWPVFFYNLDFRTPIRLYGEMTKTKEKRTLIIDPLQEAIISTPDDFQFFSIKDNQTIPPVDINGLTLKCSIQKGTGKKPLTFESKIIGKEGMMEGSPSKNFTYTIPAQFISPASYTICRVASY